MFCIIINNTLAIAVITLSNMSKLTCLFLKFYLMCLYVQIALEISKNFYKTMYFPRFFSDAKNFFRLSYHCICVTRSHIFYFCFITIQSTNFFITNFFKLLLSDGFLNFPVRNHLWEGAGYKVLIKLSIHHIVQCQPHQNL